MRVSRAAETTVVGAGSRISCPEPSVTVSASPDTRIWTLRGSSSGEMECPRYTRERRQSQARAVLRRSNHYTWVHPPGKWSAHDTPENAVRARLGRFDGEVTTTQGATRAQPPGLASSRRPPACEGPCGARRTKVFGPVLSSNSSARPAQSSPRLTAFSILSACAQGYVRGERIPREGLHEHPERQMSFWTARDEAIGRLRTRLDAAGPHRAYGLDTLGCLHYRTGDGEAATKTAGVGPRGTGGEGPQAPRSHPAAPGGREPGAKKAKQ